MTEVAIDNRTQTNSGLGRQFILIEAAALSGAAIIVYLAPKYALGPRAFGQRSDLIACVVLLLWIWPIYLVIRRHAPRAQVHVVPKSFNESALLQRSRVCGSRTPRRMKVTETS
jgi:hypothetical protein